MVDKGQAVADRRGQQLPGRDAAPAQGPAAQQHQRGGEVQALSLIHISEPPRPY